MAFNPYRRAREENKRLAQEWAQRARNPQQSIPTTHQKDTNMKKIVYLIVQNGVDGKEPTNEVYASWSEEDRDNVLAASRNKNYFRTEERIVGEEKVKAKALKKLTATEKLLLGHGQKTP